MYVDIRFVMLSYALIDPKPIHADQDDRLMKMGGGPSKHGLQVSLSLHRGYLICFLVACPNQLHARVAHLPAGYMATEAGQHARSRFPAHPHRLARVLENTRTWGSENCTGYVCNRFWPFLSRIDPAFC